MTTLKNSTNADIELAWGQFIYKVPANGVAHIKPAVARAMLVRFPDALSVLGDEPQAPAAIAAEEVIAAEVVEENLASRRRARKPKNEEVENVVDTSLHSEA